MKKSNRILVAGIIVESLLAAIGLTLLMAMATGDLIPATSAAETRATIFTVLGGAMGTIGGLLLVLWIVALRGERAGDTRHDI